MRERSLFWLGLFIGALAAFGPRRLWEIRRTQAFPTRLIDLVDEAVIVYDALGTVTYASAAAMVLCGSDLSRFSRLYYPSGQRVPPGQLPVNRARQTGKVVTSAGCRYGQTAAGEARRVLDVTASPLPDGGVAVVFKDSTALEVLQLKQARSEARQKVLQSLCRRLSVAANAEALASAVAESVYDLLSGLPEGRAAVFVYDCGAQTIAQMAVVPDSRSKRPHSPPEAHFQKKTAFDASLPLHWQIYVARQPFRSTDAGEMNYALPLIAAGLAIGHLSVVSQSADAWADAELCDALGMAAAIAAPALAGPQSAGLVANLSAQMEALRLVASAAKQDRDTLADLIAVQVRKVIGAELCTVVMREGKDARLLGRDYEDTLLRPERHSPGDPALWDKAARKAMKTGKTMQKIGIINPSFEAGPWRAFAGQSGRHSVLAVPLASGQGVLTVYTRSASGFPEGQVNFVEMLASLFPASLLEAHGG